MEVNLDNLKRLIESLKAITFFDRLFRWNLIKNQLIDSNGDLQKLVARLNELTSANTKLENQLSLEQATAKNLQDSNNRTHTEYQVLKESSAHSSKQIEALQNQIATLTEQNKNYFTRVTELAKEVAIAKQRLEALEVELLKANNQVGGIESYNYVVALLVNYYKENSL